MLTLSQPFFLIRCKHLHDKVTSDHDLSDPQKFHKHADPRIGGVGIFVAFVISTWVTYSALSLERDLLMLQICLYALPAFTIGTGDLTKILKLVRRHQSPELVDSLEL